MEIAPIKDEHNEMNAPKPKIKLNLLVDTIELK